MKKLDSEPATDQQYRELKGRYDDLERRYQEAFDIPGHCDLILEVKE